jgi:putative ABC transport system substrate-binding protein
VVWIACEFGANIARRAEGATHVTPTVDPPYRPGMDRRRFLLTSLAGGLAAPVAGETQQATKPPRIAYLITSPLESPEGRASVAAFRQGLRERGYAENQNVLVEYRSVNGRIDRYPEIVAEVVRLKVDIIVAAPTPAARAAQQATRTIPIVAAVMGDPVGDGLVASLARPGGNITGLTFIAPELVPKRLAILKEALPGVSRIAVLFHPGAFSERTTTNMLKETDDTARALGVRLQHTEVRGAEALAPAFSRLIRERAEAVLVSAGSMFFAERRRLVALAEMHKLPAMYNSREFADLGGLIGYGASVDDLIRRAGQYVDRILKGAHPGSLPVEQATKFELVINLKTARALGLTIPPSLLARADQVIE